MKKIFYDSRNYLWTSHIKPYIYHHARSVSLGALWLKKRQHMVRKKEEGKNIQLTFQVAAFLLKYANL